MPKKRILILCGGGGMGHKKAAEALEKAMQRRFPEIEVKNANVLDLASKTFKNFFEGSYNILSQKIPFAWKILYDYFEARAHDSRIPKIISKLAVEKKLIRFIKDFSPEFIISTHPFPMHLLSYAKHESILNITSANVMTDFGCHKFWVNSDVNFYFVAAPEVKKCLRKYGVPDEKIYVTGIPINEKFGKTKTGSELYKKIGLKENIPVILILGGQLSVGDCKKVLQELSGKEIQIMVIAGRGRSLESGLKRMNTAGNFLKVFGYVDNLYEFMAVSDIIVTKAGGLTVSECLAAGLPMIIYKIIPGQEEENLKFLLRHRAAIKANMPEEIAKAAYELISNKPLLESMKKNCRELGRPDAAFDVAKLIHGLSLQK